MINLTDTQLQITAKITAHVAPGKWTSLTELRTHLANWTRQDVDTTLRLMERFEDVNLVPESNQKTLTPQDRAAAVNIGDQDKHLIWLAG